MGSLVSTPRTPAPIVVPALQSEPVQSVSQPKPKEPEGPTPEEQASETRRRSLLARNRGRLGTIATSLQGFLTQGSTGNQRKTLLGE
ncbi:MAG: hypothetical protein GC137_06690 [Alphaproteobacteria bacterium]|nr:hypothetical protein [Alphaproteobacteria bacterium]